MTLKFSSLLEDFSNEDLQKELLRRENEKLRIRYEKRSKIHKFIEDNKEAFLKLCEVTQDHYAEGKIRSGDFLDFSVNITFEMKDDLDDYYDNQGNLRWESICDF